MVLLKALGMIDVGMALMLGLTIIDFGPNRFYFFFTLLHAIKAIVFIKNFLSLLDLVIVLYTLILPFWSNDTITIIFVAFLGIKGLYSLL